MPNRLSSTASETPTYYNLRAGPNESAVMDDGDVHRAIYNLTVALMGIGQKLDDGDTTLFGTNVTTDLRTAHANIIIPPIGPVT